MPSDLHTFDEIKLPFIFVPHGAPEPTEWLRNHTGWTKLPATLEPNSRGDRQVNRLTEVPRHGRHGAVP
jgi:hypothetical protein